MAVEEGSPTASAGSERAGGALPDGVELTELDSGVRVVTEVVPSVRSVALGIWVRTGSRDEDPEVAGVSHFLEHLLFKGTRRHSATRISELFDGMGASANASTSKELTNVHARLRDEHTAEAFDLLAEMYSQPALPPDEIDSERRVVLEEIAMYEDEPSERVHDVLAEAIYGAEHPLGRRILGEAEVIGSVPVESIADYHRARYTASRTVVAAAGRVDHEAIVSLAGEHLDGLAPGAENGAVSGPAPDYRARLRFNKRETDQFHICFGGSGIARGDERRFTLSVLDAALGGSVSSRLFREIREKRGLAYAVGSYAEQHQGAGMVGTYVGTRPENVAEACEIVARELAGVRHGGVEGEELDRAKERVKGRLVLSEESTAGRMFRLAQALEFEQPLLSIDERVAKVDAVTAEDIAELAAELYAPETMAAAAIGPDPELFRRAVAEVSPGLAEELDAT